MRGKEKRSDRGREKREREDEKEKMKMRKRKRSEGRCEGRVKRKRGERYKAKIERWKER